MTDWHDACAAAVGPFVFRHFYERDHLSQVLAAFGVTLMVEEAVRAIWGSAPLRVLQRAWLDDG